MRQKLETDAVYQGGMLKPARALPLAEGEAVKVTVQADSLDPAMGPDAGVVAAADEPPMGPARWKSRVGFEWTGTLEEYEQLLSDENHPWNIDDDAQPA